MYTTISSAEGRVKQLRAVAGGLDCVLNLHQAREVIAAAGGYDSWPHLKGMLNSKTANPVDQTDYFERMRRALGQMVGGSADSIVEAIRHLSDSRGIRVVHETNAHLIFHASGETFWTGRTRSSEDRYFLEEFLNGPDSLIEFRSDESPEDGLLIRHSWFKGQPSFVTCPTRQWTVLESLCHPLLEEFRELQNGPGYCWTTPKYRRLCETFRFNPDRRRPAVWRLSDQDVSALIALHLPPHPRRRESKTMEGVLDLVWYGIDVVQGARIDNGTLTKIRQFELLRAARRDRRQGSPALDRVEQHLAQQGISFDVRALSVTVNIGGTAKEGGSAPKFRGSRRFAGSDWGRPLGRIRDFINGR